MEQRATAANKKNQAEVQPELVPDPPPQHETANVVQLERNNSSRRAGRGAGVWPGSRLVMDKWPEIVGADISRDAVPVACDNGILTIRTSSTAWAAQLRLLSKQIIAKIEAVCGDGIVSRIEFMAPSARQPKASPPPVVEGSRRTTEWEPWLGAQRLSERIAGILGLPVVREDVWELVHLGHLEEAGEYKGAAMYFIRDADSLCADQRDLIELIVSTRVEWATSSYEVHDARRVLGVSRHDEFIRITTERAIWPGPDDRYAKAEIDASLRTPNSRPRSAEQGWWGQPRRLSICESGGWTSITVLPPSG
ncbi:DciA family protein [Nocardia sp. NPDC006044]|uniref:DciA family protein n=1 Tax=Nocardia sp. NPDC006044 TaxID=3364306 RepID=UPI0036B657AA